MTPSQLAARLTIHEHDSDVAVLDTRRLRALGGGLRPAPVGGLSLVESDAGSPPTVFQRESLHRRLLAAADVLGAGLALLLALVVLGDARPTLPALAGIPLVVVLFKVAGLYDRDQLRIVHSTLDETPLLAQLTGLYALSVTILQPVLLDGRLEGLQVAVLWLFGFAAIVGGRTLARWLAARLLPPSAAW